MANISKIERVRRLIDIKSLLDEGKGVSEISELVGLPIQTINRNIKYIEELAISEISPEELAKKRQEIYLELAEAIEEAQTMFNLYKDPVVCPQCGGVGTENKDDKIEICKACKGFGFIHKAGVANQLFISWVNAIEKKAKLYGLDSVKNDGGFTFNQQINVANTSDKIDVDVADRLSKMIKSNHDKKIRDKYESEGL